MMTELVARMKRNEIRGLCTAARIPDCASLHPGYEKSERIPRRLRSELQIADVRAEPQADAGADWNHDDASRGQRRHADAADQIGRAVDAGEALVDRAGRRQAVDQHHGARAFAAHVPAQRRSRPVDAQVADVLRITRALAVAQSADERAAALLAQHVAVRLAPGGEVALHHTRETARHAAEKSMAGIE